MYKRQVQSGQEGSTPVVSSSSEATSSSESDLEESPSPAVSASNQQGEKDSSVGTPPANKSQDASGSSSKDVYKRQMICSFLLTR